LNSRKLQAPEETIRETLSRTEHILHITASRQHLSAAPRQKEIVGPHTVGAGSGAAVRLLTGASSSQ